MKRKFEFSIILLFATCICYSQCTQGLEQWKDHFKERIDLDPIEGIWSQSVTVTFVENATGKNASRQYQNLVKIAVFKEGGKYYTCTIDDQKEFSLVYENTVVPGVYLMRANYDKTNTIATSEAYLNDGFLRFEYWKPDEQIKFELGQKFREGLSSKLEHQWIKVYPNNTDIQASSPTISSGTGFAISEEGIIVTNHHVVSDAKKILVRGVEGDFYTNYNAQIIFEDINNDLALLIIKDENFSEITDIPFTIEREVSEVGEGIFVLGYPLRSTMGDEMKLTNGIISSRTGYQGDITSYQVSAPVQPGNSGGPVFNNKGVLVGIINAKHSQAENAAYAIKSSYLFNLFELLDNPIPIRSENKMQGLSLSDQVKILKKVVYIIEVYE